MKFDHEQSGSEKSSDEALAKKLQSKLASYQKSIGKAEFKVVEPRPILDPLLLKPKSVEEEVEVDWTLYQ